MLWLLLVLLMFLWIIRFGLGIGAVWIPAVMIAGWICFVAKLFMHHEHH